MDATLQANHLVLGWWRRHGEPVAHFAGVLLDDKDFAGRLSDDDSERDALFVISHGQIFHFVHEMLGILLPGRKILQLCGRAGESRAQDTAVVIRHRFLLANRQNRLPAVLFACFLQLGLGRLLNLLYNLIIAYLILLVKDKYAQMVGDKGG